MRLVLYCRIVVVNYSFTGIPGCLGFEQEVLLVAWTRLGGCCLVCSPILRSRRFQFLEIRSLDYQATGSGTKRRVFGHCGYSVETG